MPAGCGVPGKTHPDLQPPQASARRIPAERNRCSAPSTRASGTGVLDVVGEQDNEQARAERHRRGASGRAIGPPALCFDPEVTPDLAEGDLDRPATDKPGEHVGRIDVGVHGEQGPGLEAAGRITDERPAQRHDGSAGTAPDGAPGGRFGLSLAGTMPVGHGMQPPRGGGTGQPLLRCRQPAAGSRRLPTQRGKRRGAGANRQASSRRRVTTQARERTASSRLRPLQIPMFAFHGSIVSSMRAQPSQGTKHRKNRFLDPRKCRKSGSEKAFQGPHPSVGLGRTLPCLLRPVRKSRLPPAPPSSRERCRSR